MVEPRPIAVPSMPPFVDAAAVREIERGVRGVPGSAVSELEPLIRASMAFAVFAAGAVAARYRFRERHPKEPYDAGLD